MAPMVADPACEPYWIVPDPTVQPPVALDPTFTPQLDPVDTGGYVCVVVVIDTEGRVTAADIVATDNELLAVDFVNQIKSERYKAATKDGEPVEFRFLLTAAAKTLVTP